MEEICLEPVPQVMTMPALHKTNALVHNPFAWGDDAEDEIRLEVAPAAIPMPALHKTNALVHNPFAWSDDDDEATAEV